MVKIMWYALIDIRLAVLILQYLCMIFGEHYMNVMVK